MFKNFLKLAILYLITLIVGTVLYIASFWLSFLNAQAIPLAGALVPLMFICLVVLIILVILKRTKRFSNILTYRDVALIIVILFFSNFFFYTTVPFNCARSNSIIMVGYLYKQHGAPKTEKEIQEFVGQEYFQKYQAIQKRLQEQINAGNVKEVNGGYVLTERGILVVKVFGFITDLYNMDQNFTKL